MTNLQLLAKALQESWSADTAYFPEHFSTDNPARGQCVVSSLVVQDYFGGELVRVIAKGKGIDEKHYFNLLDDGTEIDTIRQQYQNLSVNLTPAPVDLKGKYATTREKLLDDEDTRRRYELLKQRVTERLVL